MQVYRLKAVVEPDECGVHAWCPALKGCHTWGTTVEEALDH
jgi:predicted RNase H-like HicB family nuclease